MNRTVTTAGALPSPRRADRPWLAINLLLALALSAGVVAGARTRVPHELTVSTDIVGYPIFANYNIERILDLYYLTVVVLPVLTLLTLPAVARATALLRPRDPEQGTPRFWPPDGVAAVPRDLEDHGDPDVPSGLAAAGRVLAVGALFGLQASIVGDGTTWRFWLIGAGVALTYAGVAVGVAGGLYKILGGRQSISTVLARVNALAAPLALIGLLTISNVTSVTVQSDGAAHHYAWLPSWLALTGTALLVGWIARGLALARTDRDVRRIERWSLLLITGPTFLFVLISFLPGGLGLMDMFHEGELLVGSRLFLAGSFPWRDLMSTHGVLADSLVPSFGIPIFGNSRWGVAAGALTVLNPLLSLPLYLLAVRFFHRSWPFIVLVGAAIVGSQLAPFLDARFKFWPLVLLLLGIALDHPAWWRSALLGAALVVQMVLIPEAAYCIPACGIILVLYESYHRAPGALAASFSRTLWCAAAGVGVATAIGVYLQAQHALGAFFFYFVVVATGHELTGGLPTPPDRSLLFLYLAVGPLVAIVVTWVYLVASVLRRRPLRTIDWIMGAAGIFASLYYPKFLERMDVGHAIQVCAAVMPLIVIVAFRLIELGEDGLKSSLWRSRLGRSITQRPLALALLVTALVTFPGSLVSRLQDLPQQVRPRAAQEPWLSELGYSTNGMDPATYADLRTVFDSYLGPGDWVFDFSNSPGLYYYLLRLTPHSRYYHVSMTMPEVAQDDLVSELRRDRPRLVVFTSDRFGLPAWDGIQNMVRHYDVSQYILDHYRPLVSVDGQIIYADGAVDLPSPESLHLHLSQPPVTADLPFRAGTCSWGYAPSFFSISPPPPAHELPPVELSLADVGSRVGSGNSPSGKSRWVRLVPPGGHHWSDYRWLQIEIRGSFRDDAWVLTDSPSAGDRPPIAFRTLSGSSHPYRVLVGSCPQWHGYQAEPLYVGYDQLQSISAIRLLSS
jgi:hypothetical protein